MDLARGLPDETLLNHPPGLATDIAPTWTTVLTPLASFSPMSKLILFFLVFNLLLINLCFIRLAIVLNRAPMFRQPPPSRDNPTHLLVVLGSGGHTAEMLNILGKYDTLQLDWTQRTYVVSSGDYFSPSKALEFEQEMLAKLQTAGGSGGSDAGRDILECYDIATVHRARRVHQSLLTTPLSSLRCLWDCIKVLTAQHQDFRGQVFAKRQLFPDLILTNGPGTGVIVILASVILLFFGFAGPSASLPRSKKVMKHTVGNESPIGQRGQMRSIYIESWARVKTLSLSGRLLKPLVDRFLVQWPQLVKEEGKDGKLEFVGSLVT
ncbi:UDP-N-acetylglucosamine transferase subunit [Cladophialophora chaetospira]|uniref:UDP-N-acetylglucosamine transferase subunit ALG14 n=1 Tax=Cladophialophora chaetospira TaxID=386627 RepID=A0AA39CGR8_9EURO|nr:UDP-N-acetylglucosamine transferase subunit [Cladophialophora chaetospira]